MKNVKIYLMVLLLAVIGVGEMWGYNISVYSSGGGVGCGADITPSGTVAAGTTVTLTITLCDGYQVSNISVTDWNAYEDVPYSGSGTTYTFTMPSSTYVDVSVTFEEIEEQIFEYHTPTCVTSPLRSPEYVEGTNYADATPAIEGYTFEGWTKNGSYTNSTTKPTGLDDRRPGAPAIASEELYAVYSFYSGTPAAETFNVCGGTISAGYYVFSTNKSGDNCNAISGSEDGRSHISPTSITGSNTTATMNPSQRDAVWQVEASGTYWTFKNMENGKYLAATETNNQLVLVKSITDYAKWNVAVVNEGTKTYRIWNKTNSSSAIKYYNSSGSNVFASSSSGTTGNESILYLFKKTTAPGFGQTTTYTINPTCPSTAFTVTYNGNGNTGGTVPVDANEYEYGEDVDIQAGIPTKSGYDFAGWLSSYNGNTYDYNNTFGPNYFYMGDENITLTAQWTPRVVTYLYGSSCEPLENITVTYNDAGTTWTRDYGVGTPVTVDSEVGTKGCTDWVFVGWQRGSAVANNSTSYTPVHNFTATKGDDDAVFYAVYDSVGTDWISALNISELKSGAEYVIVKRHADNNHRALSTTVANTNYLTGTLLGTDCETVKDASNNNRYKLKVTPTADMKWEASYVGGYWRLYNKTLGKYLNVNSSNYAFTATTYDEFTAANGYNDSEIKIQDRGDSKYLYWYNSGPYWEGYGSAGVFGMHTNAQKFTSTPPCSPRSVTFHGNGGTVSDGVNSGANLVVTEASRDAGITTPTATFADCNGKSWNFVGWIDREVDVTRVPVLTTEMIDDGGGNKHHDISADNEEYWAVYTNQGEPETKYGRITFIQTDFIGEYTTGTKTKTVGGNDFEFSYARMGMAAGIGIQFEAGTGVIQNTTSLGKVNYISFRGVWSGDENLSKLKIYVGETADAITTEVTSAAFQAAGDSLTYYPSANYPYVKIMSASQYVAVTSITIGYGLGTKVWATTPDCSTITLSGDVRVTSTASKTVKGMTALTVNARQLKANTALSFAAYNVADDTPNTHFGFVGSVSALADGTVTNQTIVVTYTPAADATTDGIEDVYFKATALADDEVTTTESNKQAGYGRHLPANFVIAAKAGNEWVALTAKISKMSTQDAIPIKVDNTTTPTKASVALNTCEYSLLGLPNTNSRYATNGTAVHLLSSQTSKVLNATKNISAKTYLNTGATATNAASSDSCLFYEWKLVSSDLVHYTVTNSNELSGLASNRILGYSTASGKWGMYASGSGTNQDIFLLPIETVITDMEAEVMEWGTTSMVLRIAETAPSNVNITLGGTPSGSKALTAIAAGSDLYKVEGLTLTGSNCEVMMIADATDASKGTLVRKPILVSGEATGSTYTSAPGRDVCANCDIIILNGGKLTADENKASGDHVDFANIYVYPGGKLVLDAKSLGVKQQVYVRGGYSWLNTGTYALPELYLNGNINFNGSGKIIYDYYIQNYKYYQFALPYTVPLAKVTDEAGVDNFPVWVKHYNGALRAANAQATSWEWYEGENFEAGIGYIIAARPRQVEKVQNRPLSIIRFPLGNSAYNGSGETEKSVSTTAHGITGYGAGSVTANNVGWNFVGNPYMATWKGDIGHQQLEKDPDAEHWNGSYHWADGTTKYITVMSPEDGTDYDQYVASTTELKPFFPFYFQETAEGGSGTLTFTLANRIKKAPAAVSADTPREAFVQIDMMDGTSQDQTGVYVGDKYSDELDFDDMQKVFGSLTTKPKVWLLHNDTRMAFEAMSEERAAGSIPMGYRAPESGEYTFTISEYSDLKNVESVLLNDNELGVYNYDLLSSDYEFESTEVLYNDTRFTIRIVLKDENAETPTGIETIYLNSEEPLKFIYHDKMYILRGGVIYDATGKQVKEVRL